MKHLPVCWPNHIAACQQNHQNRKIQRQSMCQTDISRDSLSFFFSPYLPVPWILVASSGFCTYVLLCAFSLIQFELRNVRVSGFVVAVHSGIPGRSQPAIAVSHNTLCKLCTVPQPHISDMFLPGRFCSFGRIFCSSIFSQNYPFIASSWLEMTLEKQKRIRY